MIDFECGERLTILPKLGPIDVVVADQRFGLQWMYAVNARRGYPTGKVITLMRWCIAELRLRLGATLLDLDTGSGWTGVDAVQLGYNFINFDVHRPHVAIEGGRAASAEQVG
jgi:hypothetical protein